MSNELDSYWCLPLAADKHREVAERFPEVAEGEDFIQRSDVVAGIVMASDSRWARRLPAWVIGMGTVVSTKFLVRAFGGQVEAEGITSKERIKDVLQGGNVIAISVESDDGSHAEYVFPGGRLSLDQRVEPGFVDSLADRVARTVREGHNKVNLLRIEWDKR